MLITLGIAIIIVMAILFHFRLKDQEKQISKLNNKLIGLEDFLRANFTRANLNKAQEEIKVDQTEAQNLGITLDKPAPASSVPARARAEVKITPKPSTSPTPTKKNQDWINSFENNLGKKWMTWIGVLILFCSVGFFIKYSIEHSLLTPTARISIAMSFGVLLLIGGSLLIKREMVAIGQGIIGGGLAILYVSIFAAFGFYNIISQIPAVILMSVVTIIGMTLAVRFNAIVISILACLGGFLTPIMISNTNESLKFAILGYMLLLNLGVLGVAFFKQWRLLDILAFSATTVIFNIWFREYYTAAILVPTLLWLGGFFVTFFILPFMYSLRHRVPITVERFILAIANAAIAFIYASDLLQADHKYVLGVIALCLSLAYLGMGVLFRRLVPSDKLAPLSFLSLSMIFLTITIPLLLGLDARTLAWAIEAPTLLFLGYRYAFAHARKIAAGVLALTIIYFFYNNWHDFEYIGNASQTLFINKGFGLAIFIAIAMWTFCYIHHRWQADANKSDTAFKLLAGIGAGFFVLLHLQSELTPWLEGKASDWSMNSKYLRSSAMIILWSLATPIFAFAGSKFKSQHTRIAGLLAMIIAFYFAHLSFYSTPSAFSLFINLRFAAMLFGILSLFTYAKIIRKYKIETSGEEQSLATVLLSIAGFMTLIIMSLDIHIKCEALDQIYISKVSTLLLWSLGGLAFLLTSVMSKRLAYRFVAIIPLIVATVMAINLYESNELENYTLGLNMRFIVTLIFISAIMILSKNYAELSKLITRQDQNINDYSLSALKSAQELSKIITAVAAFALFVLLSVEPALYFHNTIPDHATAQKLIHMSLSIVWSLYATGAIIIGFWRNLRGLRFAGLAIFGLTALKLVIIDMANVNQIYRIVSFLILGLLMIGASFLYHKLEKRLAKTNN